LDGQTLNISPFGRTHKSPRRARPGTQGGGRGYNNQRGGGYGGRAEEDMLVEEVVDKDGFS